MQRLIYILLLVLLPALSFAQVKQQDSARVEVRSFDDAAMNSMKQDADMQYDRMEEPKLSWWDRFWMWFWWQVNQMMKTREGRFTMWTTLIVLAVAGLAFAVYKIKAMNKAGLFASGGGSPIDFTVGHEDIHEIDFEGAIAKATDRKEYRLAVRLLYLQSLKTLADKNLIEWKINKTNNDYVREVRSQAWQPLFSGLTYQFEYSWYGEATVSYDKFVVIRNDFHQLHKQLQ